MPVMAIWVLRTLPGAMLMSSLSGSIWWPSKLGVAGRNVWKVVLGRIESWGSTLGTIRVGEIGDGGFTVKKFKVKTSTSGTPPNQLLVCFDMTLIWLHCNVL